MRSIALYGKGGIGKTTVASNLSALFARSGRRVLQVGCDPKHDSSYPFVDSANVRTVMGALATHGERLNSADFLMKGRGGVDCIETGGPEPGVGCAGRGITLTFETLLESDFFAEDAYDIAVFDVLGDVVCGGFAAPLRKGFAKEVYVVLSGEIMAIWAANNICKAIARFHKTGVGLGGFVANLRGAPHELETLKAFADLLGARLLPPMPRDDAVLEAERHGRTVIEYAPRSAAAGRYETLFEAIDATRDVVQPTPLDDAGLERFLTSMRFR